MKPEDKKDSSTFVFRSNSISFTWPWPRFVCVYAQNNTPGIDLDSCRYCILWGMQNRIFVQWVRRVSRLFVSASRFNWTLTSDQSVSSGKTQVKFLMCCDLKGIDIVRLTTDSFKKTKRIKIDTTEPDSFLLTRQA